MLLLYSLINKINYKEDALNKNMTKVSFNYWKATGCFVSQFARKVIGCEKIIIR
jgi:hypothetical protein